MAIRIVSAPPDPLLDRPDRARVLVSLAALVLAIVLTFALAGLGVWWGQ